MPRIIEYSEVLRGMLAHGFVSLYHNSGAFGFTPDAKTQAVGWIGPPDPTLNPHGSAVSVQVSAPIEGNLAILLVRTWRGHLPGKVWLMPLSHWAHELDFASRAWMPQLLRGIGIDSGLLAKRNDGAAIEFAESECDLLELFARGLLENLCTSDFVIAFLGRHTHCTLHHHKQLWWVTTDEALAERLRRRE